MKDYIMNNIYTIATVGYFMAGALFLYIFSSKATEVIKLLTEIRDKL